MPDALDIALSAELRARAAVIAIGEQLKSMEEEGRDPTEEELRLHAHLVHEWQKVAHAVTKLLDAPLRTSHVVPT